MMHLKKNTVQEAETPPVATHMPGPAQDEVPPTEQATEQAQAEEAPWRKQTSDTRPFDTQELKVQMKE